MRALRGVVVAVFAIAVLGGTTSAHAQTIQLTPVVIGLTQPVFVTPDGTNNGDLYILEQGGVIKRLASGASTPTTLLDITSKVATGGERGLLGLAFPPGGGPSKYYVDYTRQPDGAVVVSEFTNGVERVLLTIDKPFANHNGGMLAFGPDGKLYIGVGDGGSANDPGNRAQNLGLLLGKVLRIDPAPAGTQPYTVPADNPFVGQAGKRPEIWAYGLRNPWRFSFERGTGTLWLGDVGQGAREEVDHISKGGNYGWRVFEGMGCTGLDAGLCVSGSYISPVTEYPHTGGRCSITGGYAYQWTSACSPSGRWQENCFLFRARRLRPRADRRPRRRARALLARSTSWA
jgi:glucose/arabinose dehydrogenase